MSDEWQVATGKGSRGHSHTKPKAQARAPAHDVAHSPPPPERVTRWCGTVRDAAETLAKSEFYRELESLLLRNCSWPEAAAVVAAGPAAAGPGSSAESPCAEAGAGESGTAAVEALQGVGSLVVYGLGSLEQPGAQHIRHQAALATLLLALLGPGASAEAFDPVFSPLDRAVLQALCIQVTGHDEGGRRVATCRTLFYLPHCEAVLASALLEANVAAGTLHNVLLLGNRFSGYMERFAGGGCHRGGGWAGQPRPKALLALCAAGAVLEVRVEERGFPVVSAFNDAALHCFPEDWKERLEAVGDGA